MLTPASGEESSPPPDAVADVVLRTSAGVITTVPVQDLLDVTDAQIGSMFVTPDTAKTTIGPVEGHDVVVVVDGEVVQGAWDVAKVRIPLERLSRWQRTKLLWAPTLRRVSLRVRRDGEDAKVRVRRRWPR